MRVILSALLLGAAAVASSVNAQGAATFYVTEAAVTRCPSVFRGISTDLNVWAMGSSQTTLAAGIASCAAPLNAFQINKLVANRMRGFMTFRGRYVQTRVVGTKTVLVVAKAGAVPGATTHVFEIVNIAAPTAPKYVLKHLPTNMCVQSDGMHLALVNCNNVGARSVIGVRNV